MNPNAFRDFDRLLSAIPHHLKRGTREDMLLAFWLKLRSEVMLHQSTHGQFSIRSFRTPNGFLMPHSPYCGCHLPTSCDAQEPLTP